MRQQSLCCSSINMPKATGMGLACPHSHQTDCVQCTSRIWEGLFSAYHPRYKANHVEAGQQIQHSGHTDPKPLAIRKASIAKCTESGNLHRPPPRLTALLPSYWFPPKLCCPSSLWTCLNGVQQKGNLRC